VPKRNQYTTQEVAAILNRKPNTIAKLATFHNRGMLRTPRLRLYSDADVAFLRTITERSGK
jgi:hypothetical protein